MSVGTALWVLAWVAIVVLYLALSVVLREVRTLRAQVSRLTEQVARHQAEPGALATPAIVMPASVTGTRPRVVLAAESTCPLCRVVLARLGRYADSVPGDIVLLTHEPSAAWDAIPAGIDLVRDDDAWREIAHLSPPILFLTAADGHVVDLVLPSRESDVDSTIQEWISRISGA